MKLPNQDRYNYYAEQVTKVMAQNELIFEEDVPIMEEFIRGCA